MARSIQLIQNQILDAKLSQTALAQLNSPSMVAIYVLWAYCTAVGINLFEQTLDIFKASLELTVANQAGIGTPPYIQSKIFGFQYSVSNPQVVTLVNTVPAYQIIDPTLQIISRCSVKTNPNKEVNIKIATGEPPAQLSSLQATALDAYWSDFNIAGVTYNIINLASDKLYLSANIYYNGQYSATIQADVIAAIKAYLAAFSLINFDGTLKLSLLEDAIQKVAGVTDVQFLDVGGRKDTVVWANRTVITRTYNTYSGYMVEENTSGKTFTDSLNFIIEN